VLPEELELLRIQVEMEGDQLHLAESRLEQAKRWESRAKELAAYGGVPMEQLMDAQGGGGGRHNGRARPDGVDPFFIRGLVAAPPSS
jgi:hypothetical protein